MHQVQRIGQLSHRLQRRGGKEFLYWRSRPDDCIKAQSGVVSANHAVTPKRERVVTSKPARTLNAAKMGRPNSNKRSSHGLNATASFQADWFRVINANASP